MLPELPNALDLEPRSHQTQFQQISYWKNNPNVIVSKDWTGNFQKIMQAVEAVPDHSRKRFAILVKRGVYKENVDINVKKTNLVLIGEGMDVTTITGHKSNAVKAEGFIAIDIGFENTAGPHNGQAVALLVKGDQSAFFRCKINGYQDTLYAHNSRQFFRECKISGTVDFIFGYSTAVFQMCTIIARKDLIMAWLQLLPTVFSKKTQPGLHSNFVTYVTADADLLSNITATPTYLGRPWGYVLEYKERCLSVKMGIVTYMISFMPKGNKHGYLHHHSHNATM
ncbi:pectinesterase/pectinesterase inhibitor PPE8B-like [Rosa rugosa]|uniref:pectinesterase/pectinesterase inhibitor PPE8B-like n=1 Tax=Rosa rugosa TaxID=74645 RepID=UPI002B411EBE|nr:pectinesterase/pectinesterase inhibitor PPE8B-like [Rosa rugosa]